MNCIVHVKSAVELYNSMCCTGFDDFVFSFKNSNITVVYGKVYVLCMKYQIYDSRKTTLFKQFM